ncbi:MmyB family transcriptional regulator, partial [Klebsiella quasipneumoniae]
AAARVLTDYGQLPLAERNVLRRLFTRPEARCTLEDWQTVGQLIVNAFRADVTRMGATTETDQLIAELSQQSVEFARFWQSHDVAGHGEGYKRIHHPQMGPLDLEFTSFAVEGRPDLSLLVFNPATTESQRKIHGLLQASGSSSGEY